MKRIAAILFLCILVFNVAGYKILLYCLESQHAQAIEASLDRKEYADNELVAIRIPFDLPYESNWKGYARVNGQAEINGHVYTYVKCKITGGELVLMCLPDAVSTQLTNAGKDFFKLTNDLSGNDSQKKQPANSLLEKFISLYETVPERWKLQQIQMIAGVFTKQDEFVRSQHQPAIPGKPPRSLSAFI